MARGVAVWGICRIVQQSQPFVLHLLGRPVSGLAVPARASGGPGCGSRSGSLAFGDPSSQDAFQVGQLGFLVADVSPVSCVCTEVRLLATYLDLFVTLLALSPFLMQCRRQSRGEISGEAER